MPEPASLKRAHTLPVGKIAFDRNEFIAVGISCAGLVIRPGSRPRGEYGGPGFCPSVTDAVEASPGAAEYDGIPLEFLLEFGDTGTALFRRKHAAVEPDFKQRTVIAPKFGKLLFDHCRIFPIVFRCSVDDTSGEVDPHIGICGSAAVDSRFDSVFSA